MLALAGGLVLNLMPCVLPVLSVKALALVQHGRGPPAVLRRHGLAYLASFVVVAGALIALRAGGGRTTPIDDEPRTPRTARRHTRPSKNG